MRKLGDLLLGFGLVVGIGAIVGYQLDIIPPLPPAVLKLVLYKLIFVGAIGLLVAGALIRRMASKLEALDVDSKLHRTSNYNAAVQSALPPPPASEVISRKVGVRDKPPSAL